MGGRRGGQGYERGEEENGKKIGKKREKERGRGRERERKRSTAVCIKISSFLYLLTEATPVHGLTHVKCRAFICCALCCMHKQKLLHTFLDICTSRKRTLSMEQCQKKSTSKMRQ